MSDSKSSNRLNPCSNGRYSRSIQSISEASWEIVLILVLMEDTLGGGALNGKTLQLVS